tara:strand:- start:2026 stop:3309 length:1284 start_codon:yes stop_codon:yes gene_type:complete
MENKEITILGSGLTGCLTAYKLAKKYPKKKIYLIDGSKNILSGLNSVNISKHRVNNGYHGIDVNRNLPLYNFFKKKIKISFKLFKDNRKIILNNLQLKEGASIDQYPKEIKKLFKIKKIKDKSCIKIYNKLPNLYKDIFSRVTKRYSGILKDDLRFFIPWFLPKEFQLISNDEGDLFRKKVRNNKIDSYIAYPKKDLFEILVKQFKKILKDIPNIYILLNTKLFVENEKFFLKRKNDIIRLESKYLIITTNVPFFLKKVMRLISNKKMNRRFFNLTLIKTNKFKHDFTETIIADKKNSSFMRLSKKKQGLTNYFLLESILKNPKIVSKLINSKKLENLLKSVGNKKNTNPKILGQKITRTIYFPNKSFLKKLSQQTKIEFKKLKNKNKNISIFSSFVFSPLNMSKCWNESERYLNEISKSISNESAR